MEEEKKKLDVRFISTPEIDAKIETWFYKTIAKQILSDPKFQKLLNKNNNQEQKLIESEII